MSQSHGNDGSDEVDELYRRASALDSHRPSESVRRAVLAHAARLAEERGASSAYCSGATRPVRWRAAVFGTLAAAALAGLMVAPRFFGPGRVVRTAAPVSQRVTPQLPRLSPVPRSAEPGVRSLLGAPPPAAAPSTASQPAEHESKARQDAPASPARGPAQEPQAAEAAVVSPSPTAFRRAAENGDLPTLRRMLDEHANIDSRDGEGRTALMLAVLRARADAVQLLLDSGADPNLADNHGTTPLQAAMAGKKTAITAALERKGAR
jgi:hypothetical protein